MRRLGGILVGLAAVGLLAAPAVGQGNLLLNGDFEVIAESDNPSYPNDPVSARVWVGDYITMGCPDAPNCGPTGWGSRNHVILPLSPVQNWEKGTGDGFSATTLTYQTVAVSTDPATVSFSGSVHTGPAGNGEVNRITVTLYDGKLPSGAEIASETVDQDLASATWYVVNLGGSSTTGFVTVAFETTTSAPVGLAGAVHCDDWGLTSSVACGTQHTTSGVNPDFGSPKGDTANVVISGSGLNLVTGVQLVNISEGDVLEATITDNNNPAALKVTMPTQGAKPGAYNVVTLQADCPPQVRQDAFTVLNDNLLLNEGFEVDDAPDPGNAKHWVGEYVTYSVPNGEGARAWPPAPPHLEGVRGYEASTEGSDLTQTIWQTIRVADGDSVTLDAYVHAGPATEVTNTVTVTLYDGTDPLTDPILGTDQQVIIDKIDIPGEPPEWAHVVLGGDPTSDYVTVEFVSDLTSVGGGPQHKAATHIDNLTMMADYPCPEASKVDTIASDWGWHDADTTGVVITGTGLTNAEVHLLQVETGSLLEAAVTTPGSTSMTVTLPTNGAETGPYNVLVGFPSCRPAVVIDGFEVRCSNQTIFDAIPGTMDPNETPAPAWVETLTINGDNLHMLDTVALTKGDLTIDGTTQGGGSSDAIDAVFNLTGAPAGKYTLSGTRIDTCDDPTPVAGAFTITPGIGSNLLFNGNFEVDEDTTAPDEFWNGPIAIDGVAWPPPGPKDGEHYGSTEDRNPLARLVHHDPVTLLFPTTDVTLTGWWRAGTTCGLSGEPDWVCTNTVTREVVIQLVAANQFDLLGDVLAEERVTLQNPAGAGEIISFPWTEFSLVGTPTDVKATVRFGWDEGSAWGDGTGVHVDALNLSQPEGPCNAPFADTDDDDDVDQDDFALFQQCYTGTNQPILPGAHEYCICFNTDGGLPADVDQTDWHAFEGCASGPDVPADLDCD